MTTDTDALTERIAMAWNGSTPEQWAEMDRHRHGPGLKALALQDAALILPIVAEEVRKAKSEAWDEGWKERSRRDIYRSGPLDDSRPVPNPPRSLNPYHETGDSDARRR